METVGDVPIMPIIETDLAIHGLIGLKSGRKDGDKEDNPLQLRQIGHPPIKLIRSIQVLRTGSQAETPRLSRQKAIMGMGGTEHNLPDRIPRSIKCTLLPIHGTCRANGNLSEEPVVMATQSSPSPPREKRRKQAGNYVQDNLSHCIRLSMLSATRVHRLLEFRIVANIIRLVIVLTCQDQHHAVWREVGEFAPDAVL